MDGHSSDHNGRPGQERSTREAGPVREAHLDDVERVADRFAVRMDVALRQHRVDGWVDDLL
jgi:hypothetical protein